MGHVMEVVEGCAVREYWVDVDLSDVWQVRHAINRHVQVFLCEESRNGGFKILMAFQRGKGA